MSKEILDLKIKKWKEPYINEVAVAMFNDYIEKVISPKVDALLVEKDAETERYKQYAIEYNRENNKLRDEISHLCAINTPALLLEKENKQFQNQKAIEELEKIKQALINNISPVLLSYNEYVEAIYKTINQSLNELKGAKE